VIVALGLVMWVPLRAKTVGAIPSTTITDSSTLSGRTHCQCKSFCLESGQHSHNFGRDDRLSLAAQSTTRQVLIVVQVKKKLAK